MNFRDKWKKFPQKKTIAIIAFLILAFIVSAFRTENIKIELSTAYTDFQGNAQKKLFNINLIDNSYTIGTKYCNIPASQIQAIKDIDLPKEFKDFKIEIYCIDAFQAKDESIKKARWYLNNIEFFIYYPTDIIETKPPYTYETRKNVLKKNETFLIGSQRSLQFSGVNLDFGSKVGFTMQFIGFEPSIVDYEGKNSIPQPKYLILQVRWFEFQNPVEFLKEQGGFILKHILDRFSQ